MSRSARTRLAQDRGVTMIEVVIAALVMVLLALAVLGLGSAASRNTYRAEQSQVLVNQVQAELEHIRQLPFSEVALTSLPTHSTNSLNPNYRVSGTQFALSRDGTNPKPVLYNGGTTPTGAAVSGGSIDPGPTPFTSGDVHGNIYRYVVAPWNSPGAIPANCTNCTGDDVRRVIIAVTLDSTASGGTRAYQEIQSDVADPEKRSNDNLPCSNCGSNGGQIATFWLTDTPCNQPSRQPLTGNHLTHNTRGSCSNGVQTGNTAGAPDLMFTEPPPESDAGTGTLYDYATDVEPAQNPTTDSGLDIAEPGTQNGCLLSAPPAGQLDLPVLNTDTNKQTRYHVWLSKPLNDAFKLLDAANASLQLWTKTINGAGYSGKICIWVFKRVTVLNLLGQQVIVDVPAINLDPPLVNAARFEFSRASWPTQWTELAVPMHFIWATNALTGLNVLGQPRLGIAIQVERAGTGAPGLEFMYDHPNFESRLEVQTSTSILP
jgi:type II secretory pathway pseudopilin PulG